MMQTNTTTCYGTFFFSRRRRNTRWPRDWSSDVCSSDLGWGRDAGRHRAGAGRRRGGPVSERQRDAALPGDVVLRLVEAIAVERVHVVTPFRPDTPAPEAVLDSRAEVAGELAPGAVRLELMDADRADAAEHVRAERPRAALDRVAEHDVRVVGELVELAAAAEARAVEAVLRPAAARTDAHVLLQPLGDVDGRRPAEPPVGGAGHVQVGGAGEAAEGAAHGYVVESARTLGAERHGREHYHERRGDEGDRTLQHGILQ